MAEGYMEVRILAEVVQTLQDARDNLRTAITLTGGIRRPVLLNLTQAVPLEPEVRHHYKGQVMVDSFTALGIQVDNSPLGIIMGNIYLSIARPGIPTRLFTASQDPLPWILGHRK
jgi:hypothetical protein